MTEVEKQLIFKDISGRVNYHLKVQTPDGIYTVIGINAYDGVQVDNDKRWYKLEVVKPILYKQMPSEVDERFLKLEKKYRHERLIDKYRLFDFFDSVGYDYRGLIEMNLAINGNLITENEREIERNS